MQPSIGRIVHYVSYGTPGGEYTRECRAAIVTEVVNPDLVGLAVMNPTGMFFNREISLCVFHPSRSPLRQPGSQTAPSSPHGIVPECQQPRHGIIP